MKLEKVVIVIYVETIKLIYIDESDSLIDIKPKPIVKEVFAVEKSIREKEFYEAKALGLKPTIAFELADYLDYDNQQYIEYNNKLYSIIRTYRASESISIDLTCEEVLKTIEDI